MKSAITLAAILVTGLALAATAAEDPTPPASTSSLVVYGEAWLPGGFWPQPNGSEVTITNSSTGASVVAIVGETQDGIYEGFFFDFENSVATTGDTLFFTVPAGGYLDPGEGWFVLEDQEIERGSARYDVLPNYVADVPAPVATRLGTPYPNPFNPSVTIAFEMADPGLVGLTIHDVRGRLVARIAGGRWDSGENRVEWNGRDLLGNAAPAGTYFVHFRAGAVRESRKISLVK